MGRLTIPSKAKIRKTAGRASLPKKKCSASINSIPLTVVCRGNESQSNGRIPERTQALFTVYGWYLLHSRRLVSDNKMVGLKKRNASRSRALQHLNKGGWPLPASSPCSSASFHATGAYPGVNTDKKGGRSRQKSKAPFFPCSAKQSTFLLPCSEKQKLCVFPFLSCSPRGRK